MKSNPYGVIRSRYITEKSKMLFELKESTSNRCISAFRLPKYVFLVDPKSNKREIAKAVEMLYQEKNVKVVRVNTILTKPKPKNAKRKWRKGKTAQLKKAIVTLSEGDCLD